MSGSGYRYLRITDMTSGQVEWRSVPFCVDVPPDPDRFVLREGDIVIARSGATFGRSVRVSPTEPAVFASYLIRLRLDERAVLPAFVEWFLKSPGYWRQVRALSSGMAQPNVNARKLEQIHIPVPQLDEQRVAVERLETSQMVVASLRGSTAIAKSRTVGLRRAILRDAFAGKL